jgi:hypothetical protein
MIISLKCLPYPIAVCLYVLIAMAAGSARSGRGSIAGTVSGPARNVIPSASVKAKPSKTEPCTAQEVRERQSYGSIQ